MRTPGEVDEVNIYDFLTNAEEKTIPYGVYDINANVWISMQALIMLRYNSP